MIRSLFVLSLLVACVVGAAAFAPAASTRHSTALGPKFLKDLGFEKPSWLPEFGKKKEEEPAPEEEEETEEEEVAKDE